MIYRLIWLWGTQKNSWMYSCYYPTLKNKFSVFRHHIHFVKPDFNSLIFCLVIFVLYIRELLSDMQDWSSVWIIWLEILIHNNVKLSTVLNVIQLCGPHTKAYLFVILPESRDMTLKLFNVLFNHYGKF